MGGSILCIDNKMNMQTKNQTILINGCSDDTHDSFKYQNNCNRSSIEEKSEIISSKLQNTQVIENNNIVKQKIIISEPVIELKEGIDYEIFKIKETDKEKELLNKLFEMFKKKDSTNNNVIVKYKNGEKYIGEWDAKHLREGRGIHIFSNNNIYFGNWENNKMNGIGKMIKFSEKINDLNEIFDPKVLPFYCGNWKNNLENGEGEEIWKDNSIYKGEFKNGKYDGLGKEIFSDDNNSKNNAIFEGFFQDGEKKYGKFEWSNGCKYQGNFFKNLFHGKGKYNWNEHKYYDGSWDKGDINGNGIFVYNDGSFYEGEFIKGKKCGKGKYVWNENKYYDGNWKNDKQNGYGIYYYNGKITEGYWIDGKISNKVRNNNLTMINKNNTFMKGENKNSHRIKKSVTEGFIYHKKKKSITPKKI